MIDEQDERRKSEENTNHDELSINQNSSSVFLPKDFAALTTREPDSDLKNESANTTDVPQGHQNALLSIATNSDVNEIRDIVQAIENAVFFITDTNIDQTANRSSNTLGMRVKDSLILKAQQTQRKEIPFDELKASLACRLIVDDDLQIRFLPRIESLPLSSDGENLSTKQKKSVSLAEEVKFFDQVESEFFTENEVDFSNELMDIQNERIVDQQRTPENDDRMYDLTSRRGSFSPVDSERLFFNELDAVRSTAENAICNRDQEAQMSKMVDEYHEKSKSLASSKDAEKFDNSRESPVISSNIGLILDENERTQTSDSSAHDRVLGVRNFTIAPSPIESKTILSPIDTRINPNTSNMSKDLILKSEITKEEETIETVKDMTKGHSKDQFADVQTELIDLGNGVTSEQSRMVNEDRNGCAIRAKEQTEQEHPTKPPKDSLILNGDIEVKFEEEQSLEQSGREYQSKRFETSDNSCTDNLNDSLHISSSVIDALKAEKDEQKRSSEKNTMSIETLDIAGKLVIKNEDQSQEDSRSTQSFKNSKQQSLATIAFVETNSASAKLGPGQAALESDNEVDKVPEKETLSANFSSEKSQSDEDTFTPEAQLNFKRSPVVDQKINNSEISERKEPPESLGKSECVDMDGPPANENVKSSRNHQEEEIMSKTSFDDSRSINSDMMAVQNTERNISLPDEFPNSSFEGRGIDDEAIAVIEEERSEPFTIYDQHLPGFQRLSLRVSSETDLEGAARILLTCEESEADKVGRKYSGVLSKIESQKLKELRLSDEKLKRESTFDAKTSSPRSSSSPKRTTSKVSLNANLSKKSSKTNSGPDQPSTNDASSEETSSKVSPKASKSSGKFSRTDISGLIIPGSNNLRLAVETSLVYSEDRNVSNPTNTSRVAKTNSSQSELTLLSQTSLGKIQTQVHPHGVDNTVSKFSVARDGDIRDNSQSEIDHNTTDNESSTSFLNFGASGHRNKSEDASIASVSSNVKQSQRGLEPSVSTEKRNGFMEDLKRSLLSITNRSKRYKEKSETKLENLPQSQIDVKEQVDSEFSTALKDENDINLRSSQILDTKSSQSSAMIKDFLINWSQKSKIEVSEESSKEIPRSMAHMAYSVAVDIGQKQNQSSTSEVTDLSSTLDHSQNLSERNSYNLNESATKAITRELKLISKSSKDLESKPLQNRDSQNISESDSKSETDKATIQKSGRVSIEKPDFAVVADLIKPSVQDKSEGKNIIDEKVHSDLTVIENETVERQSNNSKRQDKEKQSFLLSIKSIFKSSSRSEPGQCSVASNEDPENTDVVNKSSNSSRTNKLEASAFKIEVDREESVHFTKESDGIPVIQSMKSLQDNRKRSKNRRRAGHKLLDGEDAPLATGNLGTKSYQASTQRDFIRRQNEEKTEDVGVDNRSHSSEESSVESSLQTLRTGEEEVEEQTARIPNCEKKSQKTENSEGSTKKFAISLSRIFSNSSRSKNVVKKSTRATSDTQSNPEDHFEITKIPLSSSDDSGTQGNHCQNSKPESDATEDTGEEIVAIKSLDSTHDLDNQAANEKSTEKRSSRALETKRATDTSNEQILRPKQSGTFIYPASMVSSQISSESQLAKKNSLDNVQEMRKPEEKMYVAKGTNVSYAPIVESAKYVPDELDDQSNEGDQSENRLKSSSGKSFAAIRKLFSRASIRNRQDHATVEDQSVGHAGHEAKAESKRSGKSNVSRNQKEHSMDHLREESKRESTISATISLQKTMDDDADVQNQKNGTHERAHGSKFELKKSDEVIIAEKKVKPNPSGSKSTEIVEHILSSSQTDLNDTITVEKKLNQRSNHSKKSSLLSMAKSYIKGHTEIERVEIDGARLRSDEKKNEYEDSLTLPIDGLKKSLKEGGIAKTESVLSRGFKRLFKKRSSVVDSVASNSYVEDPVASNSYVQHPVASNGHIEDPADNLGQLNTQTLSHPSINGTSDSMIETESRESRKSGTKNDFRLTVYNVFSEAKFPTPCEKGSQWLEDKNALEHLDNLDSSRSKSAVSLLTSIMKKPVEALSNVGSQYDRRSSIKYKSTDEDADIDSSAALTTSQTHIAISFLTQMNPESETRVNQDGNVARKRPRSKIVANDFRLNPSFASRRSTVVMMATPIPPREPQAEVSNNPHHSRNESSNSPTAFYYLLGPSLDEALVDVRVLFQNLIDKITGRGR